MKSSNSPTAILYTIPNFLTAGSGRVMFNILTRLDRARFSPWVCVSRRGGALEQELEDLGVPVLELPFTIPVRPYASFPRRAWQASRPFKPYGFKIWHSFHYSDDYSEPVIAHLSGARAWVYTKKSMSWGSRAWRLRSWLASRIVADNNEMPARFFARPPLAKKVRVIPHGLPLEQFSPLTPARLGLRAEYGIPSAAALAGCVAQLVPVKDHPTLLRAAASLQGVHILLAGSATDPAYRRGLEDLAASLGVNERVHFCEAVKDVPAFLAELDIFVLPTMGRGRMEGCPVSLLEAMACGKACAATDIPGSRDLILHGDCGLLVPPEDPSALAAAVASLAADPELRRKYGQAARRRAEEHFSIEREVAQHEALYSELLS